MALARGARIERRPGFAQRHSGQDKRQARGLEGFVTSSGGSRLAVKSIYESMYRYGKCGVRCCIDCFYHSKGNDSVMVTGRRSPWRQVRAAAREVKGERCRQRALSVACCCQPGRSRIRPSFHGALTSMRLSASLKPVSSMRVDGTCMQ